MRQAAQGAVHAPNENMLTYQCTTLGATEVFPCLCTTVEVAAIRQGAGGWAVRARTTEDASCPSWAHLPLHGHIFPCMGTSSPTWAHLPLHGHIFPYMGTSSPTWAHLPLHGHIFPYMGTSSPSWAHLPLHGHIFPYMGTSSPTWAHLPLHGHIFPFMGTPAPPGSLENLREFPSPACIFFCCRQGCQMRR